MFVRVIIDEQTFVVNRAKKHTLMMDVGKCLAPCQEGASVKLILAGATVL